LIVNNTYQSITETLKIYFIRIIVLIFICLPISGNSFAFSEQELSEENDTIFDSLSAALKIENVDTSKIKLLNDLAWHLAPTNVEKSILYADSAIQLAARSNWDLGKANAYNNKGEACRNKGLFEESLENHQLALNIFTKLNNFASIAKTEGDLGITYFNLSDFSKSFKHFDTALDIYKFMHNHDGILNVSGYIGVVFSNFNQHEKALEYFEKALKIAKETNNKSKIAVQLNNIALVYVDLKQYNNSINHYKMAMEIFNELDDDFNYSIALGNIGIPYTELKNYSKASMSFRKSIKLARKLDDNYGIAHQYGNLGELYLKMNNDHNLKLIDDKNIDYIEKSIRYLKLSIAEFGYLGALDDQKDYLIMLSDAYSEAGNYKSSLGSYKEAKEIQDSIQAKENLNVTASLEIKQELHNKENEIIILNQDKEYQAMIKKVVIIFAFLVLLIAGLIFYFYKKKQNDNIFLENNILKRQEIERTLRSNEKELTKHKNNLEILVKDRTIKLESEIDEHKQTEGALLMAVERAEIANNAKSVFLANMSHELRTPLVGILGYSDLLTTIVKDEEAREMANGINRTGNRLLNTLSLVLDLARIESDKFEIEITHVDVIKELKETYQNFKGMADQNNLKLMLELHSDCFILDTDVGMLKVILDNLVNNALKFTAEGEIRIVSDIVYLENNPRLILKVSDTGVGIKKKDLPIIFEEFKQLSEGFTKDFQGSGLGLSITKKFVNLLGGTILVESEYGKGTTFTISFPTEIKAVA
jgi:signal transduction histidine kinase